MKSFLDNLQSSVDTLKVPMSSAKGICVTLGTFQNDTDMVPKLVCFASPFHSCQEVLATGKETQRIDLWETWPVPLSQGTPTHGKAEAITPCV